MLSITPDGHVANVKLKGGADFGFAFGDKARFRVSVLKSKANYGMVLRQIQQIPGVTRTLTCPVMHF